MSMGIGTFFLGLSVHAWALGPRECEKHWSKLKDLPQLKYLGRPVYKFVASKTNPVIATAASFLAVDLVVHQLLPRITLCFLANGLNSCCNFSLSPPCNFIWNSGVSLGWLSFALPVMYAKHERQFLNLSSVYVSDFKA
ncbi:MAG: hypothetical protein JSR46_12410 [Verrucomicrobia bacterium]|nr:hypothetical protein [Verrucomicrobiota bacterium]